ncbi:hypothetical protein SDC9_52219 [bioreactor metagenome]|uniref:Glycosyltransferase 2-like domain-containing protein n=1 Tax=bioreactor metagenome TaxID=1076179 RepID=A0A644WV20_9ZZZZ
MDITVICPLYKAEKYIDSLHGSLLMQKKVNLKEIKYILTNTNDGIHEKISKFEKANLKVITAKEFSHSLTRESSAWECETGVIVFITQDIKIVDEDWLYNFTKPIFEGKCEAAFSRQICDNNSIERYTRINNYPEESRIVSKKDIDKLGITTFFFSDAASAVNSKIYKGLKGYDNKDLLTNEDMYFAYKLINSGYRIMYNAKAKVIHSHDYKFKELFKRYFDQGVFLKDNDYLLKYNANGSAIKLLMTVVKKSIKERNFKATLNVIPNFAARFLGNKMGQNYKKLSLSTIKKLSAGRFYWERNFENNI